MDDTLEVTLEYGAWGPLSRPLPGHLWRAVVIRDGRRYSGSDDNPWVAVAMAGNATRKKIHAMPSRLRIDFVKPWRGIRQKQRTLGGPVASTQKNSRQQELGLPHVATAESSKRDTTAEVHQNLGESNQRNRKRP